MYFLPCRIQLINIVFLTGHGHMCFDGHANCYIETGYGKGALIDFNYDTEPLPGTFPLPGIGPFGLLRNTKINHYGKMIFRWIYWHILLRGKEMPIEAHMTMAGKKNNID